MNTNQAHHGLARYESQISKGIKLSRMVRYGFQKTGWQFRPIFLPPFLNKPPDQKFLLRCHPMIVPIFIPALSNGVDLDLPTSASLTSTPTPSVDPRGKVTKTDPEKEDRITFVPLLAGTASHPSNKYTQHDEKQQPGEFSRLRRSQTPGWQPG